MLVHTLYLCTDESGSMNTVRWNNFKDALDDILTDVPQLPTKFHSAYQFATIAQDPIFYHNNIQASTPALSSFLLKNGAQLIMIQLQRKESELLKASYVKMFIII